MSPTPVALCTLASPDGPLVVAATARGIVAAEWHATEPGVLSAVGRRLGPVVRANEDDEATDRLRRARPVLEDLLAGRPADGSSVPIDLADRPLFDRRVLEAVRAVRWGATTSYGEIARRVGAPRASRAVGGALGRNPVALLIPCHRVIAADGTLGGYGGAEPGERRAQLARKRTLLRREGLTVEVRAV